MKSQVDLLGMKKAPKSAGKRLSQNDGNIVARQPQFHIGQRRCNEKEADVKKGTQTQEAIRQLKILRMGKKRPYKAIFNFE